MAAAAAGVAFAEAIVGANAELGGEIVGASLVMSTLSAAAEVGGLTAGARRARGILGARAGVIGAVSAKGKAEAGGLITSGTLTGAASGRVIAKARLGRSVEFSDQELVELLLLAA